MSKHIGTITEQWMSNASSNADGDVYDAVKSWLESALNVDVCIDGTLAVYADQWSRWLTQEEVDNACRIIDAGV